MNAFSVTIRNSTIEDSVMKVVRNMNIIRV